MTNTQLILYSTLLFGSYLSADNTPVIKAKELARMELSNIPEEVLIQYQRRNTLGTEKHIRGFILESLPKNWEITDGGKLSVSDNHSKAGVKSIRWDWNKGDVLRIKEIKNLSSLGSDRAFKISIFQETSLPKNTKITISYRRNKVRRKGDCVATRDYWMNFTNWYTFVPVTCELTKLADTHEDDIVPDIDEIVIQAPKTIKSGTFYLDRLLVGYETTGPSFNRPATNLPDVVKNGIPDEPFDPTDYIPDDNGGGTLYYGKFAKKDPIPEKLTSAQQAYIDKLRGKKHEIDLSKKLKGKDATKVQGFIDDILVQNVDGSYTYPKHMNLIPAGVDDPLLFPGDYINAGTKAYAYKWLNDDYRIRALLVNDIQQWSKHPGSKELEIKVKATLDWMKYHGIEDGKNSGENWHRSYLNRDVPSLAKAIPIFKALGTKEDHEYVNYLMGVIRWATTYNSYLFSKIPGATREVGITATQAMQVAMIEPDDCVLYRDLGMIRKRWNRTCAISDFGSMSMIKPDYTFFHHGHLIGYWGGNYGGYAQMGLKFYQTPLEVEKEDLQTYTNLAEHSIRFNYTFPTIQDINPWLNNNYGGLKDINHRTAELKSITPRNTFFDTFYGMDWNKIPAAKKYVSSTLLDFAYEPENLVALHAKYPKTKDLEVPQQIHLDLNWSAASVFVSGMSKVHARSSNSMAGSVPEPEGEVYNLGIRSLGSLFILDSSNATWLNPHLGGNEAGYDWSRTSGVTMPKLSMEEVKSLGVTGIGGGNKVLLDAKGKGLNYGGSVTFGESQEKLGSCGNLAIYIHPKMFGLDKFAKLAGEYSGQKSYHFFGDQVIALGSNLKTENSPKKRSLETTLFQQSLADDNWKKRDLRRWNIKAPLVQVDQQTFNKKGTTAEKELSSSTSILSPYGHAWLIPAGQKGKLKMMWKDQTNLVSRVKEPQAGEFVTAWIDQGDTSKASNFEYCILLNNDGKSLEAFQAYMKQNQKSPRYQVLQNDAVAHAVYGKDEKVYSYIFYTPRMITELEHVRSTEQRLNIMAKQEGKRLHLSISDPTILVSRSEKMKQSPAREVKVTLAHKGCKLISATSGLPQANPPLNATISGKDMNVLTFTTRNGVTDDFIIALPSH